MNPANVAIRRKRDTTTGEVSKNINMSLLRGFSVVAPSELEFEWNTVIVDEAASAQAPATLQKFATPEDTVCLSSVAFGAGLIALVSLLILVSVVALCLGLRMRKPAKSANVY